MANRELYIDFDLYTDNDPVFRQELIELIIKDLQEFQDAYRISIEHKDPAYFMKACHKMKTTFHMLEDQELNTLVEVLKTTTDASKIPLLNRISTEIMASLSLKK